MNPLQPPAMTVVGLEVENFKRLRAVRLVPSPTGLILVRGRNEQGKSSLIDSMAGSFGGAEETDDLPIREGEHNARTLINLGEIVIRKKWTRDAGGKARAQLVVEGADGQPIRSPQAILDMLRSKLADPVRFLSMPPKEQTETVLAVMRLDGELRRLESLEAEQYQHRTVVGREMERTKKAAEQIAREVAELPVIEVAGDASELAARLEAAKEHNGTIERYAQARAAAESRGREAAARKARLEQQLEAVARELQAAQSEVVECRQAWEHANEYVRDTPPIDVSPIVAALRSIEEAQRQQGKRDLLALEEQRAAKAISEHQAAEDAITATRAQMTELLRGAKFPIEDMAYDPDAKRLTVAGIPLPQCSHAQKLKISVAIAMAGAPAIKVIFIRDGSMLDEASLRLVAELADAHKYQVWCEIVDEEKDGAGVYIEDGEAFVDGEPAK